MELDASDANVTQTPFFRLPLQSVARSLAHIACGHHYQIKNETHISNASAIDLSRIDLLQNFPLPSVCVCVNCALPRRW